MDPSNHVPPTAGTQASSVATSFGDLTDARVMSVFYNWRYRATPWYWYDLSCAECTALKGPCPSCQIAQCLGDW